MILFEALLALCRFIQYAGAAILFGSPFLLLYGHPLPPAVSTGELRWIKFLLLVSALLVLVASGLGFIVQTAGLAGSLALALKPEALQSALWGMDFGISSMSRAALTLLALIAAIALPGGKWLWWLSAGLGAGICASFAWMGHGAATESGIGYVHLASDVVHVLAAAGWIGSLVIFCIVLLQPAPSISAQKALCTTLTSFAGVGSFFVAIIVLSGLINSAFLVGWDPERIVSTRYGQVLGAKLILFVVMLILAAWNRFRHTPALAHALTGGVSSGAILANLRSGILAETYLAAGILLLVGWLGMLAPATAQ